VDTALVVACISAVVALVSAAFSGWTQLQVAKREKEGRAEERRSDAKVILDRYRGPLLDAAWQLGDRLDNIRRRQFFGYLSEGSGRAQDAKLSTLFRFAYYLGWREFVRTQVQLLRFENEEDTRLAAALLNDVTWMLASDKLDGTWAMLWGDEQRGIGELMAEQPPGASSIVRGHAAFYRDFDEVFAPWMERFASDLFSRTAAVKSDRLRLLQWALYGLVRQLDEQCAYSGGWIDQSMKEIRQPTRQGNATKHEEQLREHLAKIKPSICSLSGCFDDAQFLRPYSSGAVRMSPGCARLPVWAGCLSHGCSTPYESRVSPGDPPGALRRACRAAGRWTGRPR
jgi:hypothetical protein